jgi:hypothetical protein
MRCVVHVRKSLDFAGQHFVLRLFPLYASERLTEIGLPKAYVAATFSNLNGDSDAMWTNVEVAQEDFEHFGKGVGRRPGDRPQVAA